MGLFDIAEDIVGGVAKVGFGVAGTAVDVVGAVAESVIDGTVDKVTHADEVRRSSGNLSDEELLRRSHSKNYSAADRVGYDMAYRDRHSDDDD